MVDIVQLDLAALAGVKAKFPADQHWKFIQIKDMDAVAVVFVNPTTSQRVSVSTPVVGACVTNDTALGKCVIIRTRSGSYYKLPCSRMHATLWQMGIQIKRPDVYKRLRELCVL